MKEFESYMDVLNDEMCKKLVEQNIEEAKTEHGKQCAKTMKAFGWCKLSKGPYAAFLIENKLNYSALKVEYLQIIHEISYRTAQEQAFITELVEDAILKTIVFYEKQKEGVTV